MINLSRYVQCHPNLRSMRHRHKKTVAVVFFIFLVVFFALEQRKDNEGDAERGAKAHFHYNDDSIIALKSQVGYLKRLLAKAKKSHEGKVSLMDDPSLPTIFAITPTYARPVQKAELTRLCHTFLLVPNFHWIIVEDAKAKTKLVTNFLRNCGVSHTHLNAHTPTDWKLKADDPSWRKPRGVLQRNEGLSWIRENIKRGTDGVLYFADDDNAYSLELFEEMRTTRKVSVWAVGLVGGLMVERPKLSDEGRVAGWKVMWAPQRPFAVDMAGFAVNLDLFLSKPKAKFAYLVKRGYQESEFLGHLVSLDELEVKGDLGTKVMIWHTRSEKVKLDMEKKLFDRRSEPSDYHIEV